MRELHEGLPADEEDENPECSDVHTSLTHEAWAITADADGTRRWHRVGFGFTNKDGSWNLQCFANPIDWRLRVRLREPKRQLLSAEQSRGESA